MEKIPPPYKEKKFLIALINDYIASNGNEIRNFETHKFYCLSSSEICSQFKELEDKTGNISPTGKPWFEEAVSRGHLKPIVPSVTYCFTAEGYNKALSFKKPFKHFWSKYWQWVIATSIALLGISANLILNLMKSQ